MSNKKDYYEHEINKLNNIIDRKQAEISRLENIIDDLPGDIYWKSKEGIYQGMNAQGRKSLRKMGFPWRKENIIGKTDYDLFGKKTADKFQKNDLKVMEHKLMVVEEESATLPSDETITQLSSKRPLFDKKGNVTGIVGNTVDITDLKEAQKKSEMANEAKSEFIANMSHDIRTPMTGVMGMFEVLWS